MRDDHKELTPSQQSGCEVASSIHIDSILSKGNFSRVFKRLIFIVASMTSHHVRIGSINTRTTKCESKLAECVIQIKRLKHDICCLQETHKIGYGEVEFDDSELKGWRVHYSGLKKKAAAGVAIVLAPHVKFIDVERYVEGRIILVRVTVHGIRLSVLSCYAPHEEYAVSSKEAFHNSFTKALSDAKKNHPSFKLLVGGDFNATIGTDCTPNEHVGKYNDDEPTSFNGTNLIDTAQSHKLYLFNTMFATKSAAHRWTFKSPLGYMRRLDYIMGEWYIKQAVKNCRSYPVASEPFESDHRVVVIDMDFPTKRMNKEIFARKRNTVKKRIPNIQKLRDVDFVKTEYNSNLDALLHDPPQPEANIDTIERNIVNAICTASNGTIPDRKKEKDVKPWVDPEFLMLLEKRRKSKSVDERKNLSKQVKIMRVQLKNAYFKKKAANINHASEQRNTEKEFRMARNYTSLTKSKNMPISSSDLHKHFSQHFSHREFEEQPELINPQEFPHIIPKPSDVKVEEGSPDAAEVTECKKQLKDGKCQGTDNVYAEHLKHATSPNLIIHIVALLNLIWTCVQVPSTWLISTITCLHKKGSKSVAENYRGISIIATLSKIVSMIIVNRIRAMYECILLPTQFGFRRNKSTCDAIFITRQVIATTKGPLYVCFIDLKAAYDWIPRESLFRVLEIRMQCPTLISILRALYTGTKACIKCSAQYFETLVGCRQGGVESPPAFNVYLDFVIRCAKHEIIQKFPQAGVCIEYAIPNECSTREMRAKERPAGKTYISELLYADDAVIFSTSIEELQEILSIYDRTFSRFGLQLSYSKTKTMAYNVDESIKEKESLLNVNGVSIENVRQFCYLGHLLTNTKEPASFLHQRIASAYQKWGELKTMLTDKDIFLTTRMKVLNACVRSRLLYSVQAWQLSNVEIRKLETIWNGFLRKMVKGGFARVNAPPRKKKKKKHKTNGQVEKHDIEDDNIDWRFKINNERLRSITKSRTIENQVHVHMLKYVAHICRMSNDALQKQVLFDRRSSERTWKRIEELLLIDRTQARRTMLNTKDFMRLLEARFDCVS